MINAVATRLATQIKKSVPEHPSSVEVLKYSIAFLLNAVLTTLLTLVIASALGKFAESAVALAGFALLRQFSGGIHLKSGLLCIIISTTGALTLAFVQLDKPLLYVLTILSLLLALWFAPSRIERQTRIPHHYYPLLKYISMLIIASNLVFHSSVLAASFFVQCLTLIKGRRRVT